MIVKSQCASLLISHLSSHHKMVFLTVSEWQDQKKQSVCYRRVTLLVPPYIESLNVSIQFIELQLEEMYAAVDDVQEMTDPSIS